jgi:hypothetical protein
VILTSVQSRGSSVQLVPFPFWPRRAGQRWSRDTGPKGREWPRKKADNPIRLRPGRPTAGRSRELLRTGRPCARGLELLEFVAAARDNIALTLGARTMLCLGDAIFEPGKF